MSMVQSRRASNGVDDSHYNDDKKFFVVGPPLTADKLPMPTHAQMQTTVHPIDERWKPSWTRRLALHPVTFIVAITVAIGLLTYAIISL